MSGPVSPMMNNRPLFFTAFSGEQFVEYNNINISNINNKNTLDKKPKKSVKRKKSALSKGKVPQKSIDDISDNDFSIFLD